MKVIHKLLNFRPIKSDLLVVFGIEGKKTNLPSEVSLPVSATKSFQGKAKETRVTDAVKGPFQQVMLIGLGEVKKIDAETIRRAAAIGSKAAEDKEITSLTFWVGFSFGRNSAKFGQALAEGAMMGSYRLNSFRSEVGLLKRITFQVDAATNAGARRGVTIGLGNCFARRLQDSPANKMRPRDLVREARKIARDSPSISAKVFDENAMKRMRMGSLLSVSTGSSEPAYLIHLIYKPRGKIRRKVCIVGKGLTFDSGGISLKPSAKMHEMKYDMSGGAAVLGTVKTLSELGSDTEVHGLVPTSENLPDGKANKPGDVVTACNGLSIEVLNTDAEGRLILADALAYATKKIKPDVMIDLATLTGAVVVALGHEMTGVMGNDESLIQDLVDSGKRTSERVWPLPILEFHKEDMRGTVGDLRNISGPGTGAGSSTGGAFLSYFVGKIPWAHLDIAGSAWGASARDYQGGEVGTGVGVRLLIDYLENQ